MIIPSTSKWDKTKAIEYLNSHAGSTSSGKCARYTRLAIEAGGIKLRMTEFAKDYGPSLTQAGFLAAIVAQILPSAGDVVVIQGYDGDPAGHMAMFNGKIWVSDFKQRTLYPGPGYRVARPAYTIYRYML